MACRNRPISYGHTFDSWPKTLETAGGKRPLACERNRADQTIVTLFSIFHNCRRENEHIDDAKNADTIAIDACRFNPMNFNITTEDKHNMFDLGYQTTNAYFKGV